MFQYAFAIALKVHNPDEDVLIDTSHFHTFFFKRYKGRNLHYGYEIDKILDKVITPIATPRQLAHLSRYMPNYLLSRFIRRYLPQLKTEYLEKADFLFDPYALIQKDSLYYEGYWQAANYFYGIEDKIKEAFRFKPLDSDNLKLICKLQSSPSVSIHVRRGDYVTNAGFGGICDLDYYSRAIDYALEHVKNPVFYIFSNDLKWCKENLTPLMKNNPYVFVNHNKGSDSYKDMELMSFCHTNIIANSSFSWWGAFLNHNKDALVICPKKWSNHCVNDDVYVKTWIKI